MGLPNFHAKTYVKRSAWKIGQAGTTLQAFSRINDKMLILTVTSTNCNYTVLALELTGGCNIL